jgi:hypothetical protein
MYKSNEPAKVFGTIEKNSAEESDEQTQEAGKA